MSTTILTDEQIETLFREHDDLYAFCHAIAAAVLQSEQMQARMEAYAAAKVREALEDAASMADDVFAFSVGDSIRALIPPLPGPVEPTT